MDFPKDLNQIVQDVLGLPEKDESFNPFINAQDDYMILSLMRRMNCGKNQ